jgi:hypothetical protein
MSDLAGLILLIGAFLDRSYRSKDHNYPFPLPTFTVGAELDGVCRVSRILEEYYYLIHMHCRQHIQCTKALSCGGYAGHVPPAVRLRGTFGYD